MGMDLYTYKRSNEGHSVTLDIRYLEAYKKMFPDDVVKIERGISVGARHTMMNEPHPEDPKYIFFGEEDDGMYYAKKKHIDARDNAFKLLYSSDSSDKKAYSRLNKRCDKLQKKLMKKAALRVIPEESFEDLCFDTGYTFTEIGYIRKPFRHYSTPTEENDGVVTLKTDNATGVDWKVVSELMGCVDESSAAIFDIKVARVLKQHVGDKVDWQKQVINQMRSKEVFVSLDW